MKRKILYLMLAIAWSLQLIGDLQQQYPNFISPHLVKRTGRQAFLKTGGQDSKVPAAITPKIHQSAWPEFCLKHLQEDPNGCSAWCEDRKGNTHLELALTGHSEVQIDGELIKQLGHLADLIPTNSRGNKKNVIMRGVRCVIKQ